MIEPIVYKALQQLPIAEKLAKHEGEPAIFYQIAPHDTDSVWGETNTPRIDYNIIWQFDPEKNTAGQLSIDVWCLNNQEIPPEDFGAAIEDALTGTFLTDDEATYCMIWARTDPFETSGTKEPKVIGVTLTFDIAEFPDSTTPEPDPVTGLNKYIKELFPDVIVIGHDALDEIWRPTNDKPAFYCKITSNGSSMANTYAVATMTPTLAGHLIAPSITGRQKWLKVITDQMAIDGEWLLGDGIPLITTQLTYNSASNPLLQGQMQITGMYRYPRKEPEEPTLFHINTEVKNNEN